MSFKEVNKLRKAGEIDKAYILATSDLKKATPHIVEEFYIDPEKTKIFDFAGKEVSLSFWKKDESLLWAKRALAWVLISFIKENASYERGEIFLRYLAEYCALNIPKEEELLYKNLGFWLVKFAFSIGKSEDPNFQNINAFYEQLQKTYYPKPSEVHSKILAAINMKAELWPDYFLFISWWELNNFRPEDYIENEISDEIKRFSLVENTCIKLSKYLLKNYRNWYEAEKGNNLSNAESSDQLKTIAIIYNYTDAFIDFMKVLNSKHPQYIYVPYYIGKLMLARGKKEEAINQYLPFARIKKHEFWVWSVLSEFYENDNEKHLACLCKSLLLSKNDKMVIKVRQKLVDELINFKLYNEAKTEISRIISIRESEEWKIPDHFHNYFQQKWYSDAKEFNDNEDFYRKHSQKAELLLYSDMVPLLGIVEFVNSKKKILYFIVNKDLTGSYKYKPSLLNPKCGDFLNLYTEKRKGKEGEYYHTHYANRTSEENPELVKMVKGIPILILEKKIGYLQDAFIPKKMFEKFNLENNQGMEINGKAIINHNKSKDTWCWKTIDLSFDQST